MFVEALKRQNPALISAALGLWQQGKIAPDSWVIDVDQVLENGKRLIETARLYGIELYLMTKQFGRNPWLAEKLLALGYSGIVAVAQLGLSPWVTVIVSIVVCAVLGVVIEFCAYKPLRQAAPLSVLITAIGVSYLLQNAALLLFGSQQMAYPTLVKLGSFSVGGVQVDGITVLTLAVTAVLMAALTLFIDKTKLGKAMRAVSEDKDAATLMGISVDRTITLTFAIGSALAAFASMFYGMTYVYIKPTTGAMPGIKAFTAAVFGGIGSIPGAMLGGILLGLIEQMSKTYISTLWADAIVFAVLVVVLVVKPTGLLGKPMQEKV